MRSNSQAFSKTFFTWYTKKKKNQNRNPLQTITLLCSQSVKLVNTLISMKEDGSDIPQSYFSDANVIVELEGFIEVEICRL